MVATAPSTLALSTARVSVSDMICGANSGVDAARLGHRIAGCPRVVDAHHVEIAQHHRVVRFVVANDAPKRASKDVVSRGLDFWRFQVKGAARANADPALEGRISRRIDHRRNVFETDRIGHEHRLDFFFDDVGRNAVDFLRHCLLGGNILFLGYSDDDRDLTRVNTIFILRPVKTPVTLGSLRSSCSIAALTRLTSCRRCISSGAGMTSDSFLAGTRPTIRTIKRTQNIAGLAGIAHVQHGIERSRRVHAPRPPQETLHQRRRLVMTVHIRQNGVLRYHSTPQDEIGHLRPTRMARYSSLIPPNFPRLAAALA